MNEFQRGKLSLQNVAAGAFHVILRATRSSFMRLSALLTYILQGAKAFGSRERSSKPAVASASSASEKISAVMFDLGGVLFESPFPMIGEYERELGLPKDAIHRVIVGSGKNVRSFCRTGSPRMISRYRHLGCMAKDGMWRDNCR